MLVSTRMSVPTAIISVGMLAGCTLPATRKAFGLQRYGFDDARAACIGDRLQNARSIGQLQQLGYAAQAYANGGAALVSLKVPIEAAQAAAACGVLTGAGTKS